MEVEPPQVTCCDTNLLTASPRVENHLFVRWFSLLFPAASPPTGSRQQCVHDEETRLQQREALRSESDKHPAETCFQHVVENKLQLKSFSSFVL